MGCTGTASRFVGRSEMLQRLHNLVRHPVEIDRGAGPDAVEMPLSPPTATSSSGAPLPRRVTSSRCGVRNDADLFPPAFRRGPSSLYRRDRRSFSQSRRPSWAFPGPSRVRSPGRPSPPARARPPRRSWPSTTRLALSTSRGAARRASVSPDTASSCGRLTAANRSRRSRSRRFCIGRRPAPTYARSCRYGSPPSSRPVRTNLPPANTDAGSSPGPTTSARRPSGAAPPKSASPGPGGSKQAASTPSSRDSDRWRKLYRGRAAVERRPVEARMEPAAHPRARYRAGPATRRPDDPRQARLRPRQGATPYRSRRSSKVKDPCVVRCSTSRASFATTGIGVSSASRSASL
jgi:hypothetical protein